MTALEKVLRAATREFGECPSWKPLLIAAWEELPGPLLPEEPRLLDERAYWQGRMELDLAHSYSKLLSRRMCEQLRNAKDDAARRILLGVSR